MSLLFEGSLRRVIRNYMKRHTKDMSEAARLEAERCMKKARPSLKRVYAVLLACGDISGPLVQAAQVNDLDAAQRLLREAVARTGDAQTIRTFLSVDNWEVFDVFLCHWMLGAPWSQPSEMPGR